MFWFLHYLVKALIALGLAGLVVVAYVNRHWLRPADDWAQTLRRVQTETLPVIGVTTGQVIRVPVGDTVVIRTPEGSVRFRIAGVAAPQPSPNNPHGKRGREYRMSRDHLEALALSNEVRVAYTFLAGETAGLGGVYLLTGTNLAIPMLSAGMAIIHEGSLKCLPVTDQVFLLAAEKLAREASLGFWTNSEALKILQSAPGSVIEEPDGSTGRGSFL